LASTSGVIAGPVYLMTVASSLVAPVGGVLGAVRALVWAIVCMVAACVGCTTSTKVEPTVYKKWPFDAAEASRRQTETAEALGVPVERTVDLGGGVTMELVLIPAGEFVMGSPAGEKGRNSSETQHKVRITKPFWISRTEVTQEQWERMRGDNFSYFKEAKNPVEQVSWDDCQAFVNKLSARVAGLTFSLPTEAEWEYACRAGSTTKYCFGDDDTGLDDYAWYGYTKEETQPVGRKKANAFGLRDMHGSVWEWCQDWYGEKYYQSSPTDDPKGPRTGEYRVRRGGAWIYRPATCCRSANRFRSNPTARVNNTGCRVVARSTSTEAEPATCKRWPFDAVDAKRRQKETARTLDVPVEKVVDLGGGVKMELVLIPEGEFVMGVPNVRITEFMHFRVVESIRERQRVMSEHEVRITRPFYMSKTEVTQEQWEQVMGENPAQSKGARKPVECVSWYHCQSFVKKLSTKVDGLTFSLPTEAEWEYACRAGTDTPFHTGMRILKDEANCSFSFMRRPPQTMVVGSFKPNAFGLYDMHGNVHEWCQDWYGDEYYQNSPTDDPNGPRTGQYRVWRSGSGWTHPTGCGSACRGSRVPEHQTTGNGCRVVARDDRWPSVLLPSHSVRGRAE